MHVVRIPSDRRRVALVSICCRNSFHRHPFMVFHLRAFDSGSAEGADQLDHDGTFEHNDIHDTLHDRVHSAAVGVERAAGSIHFEKYRRRGIWNLQHVGLRSWSVFPVRGMEKQQRAVKKSKGTGRDARYLKSTYDKATALGLLRFLFVLRSTQQRNNATTQDRAKTNGSKLVERGPCPIVSRSLIRDSVIYVP